MRVPEGLRVEKDKQVNLIIAITKHQWKWSRKAIFNYCVETCPRVLKFDIQNYSTSKLFERMTTREKSLVIKRILKMKQKLNIQQTFNNLNEEENDKS